MKLKIINTLTIIIILAFFFISLDKNALTVDYQGIKTISSLDYFFMGSTAFLGGGILEELLWLANALSLISIFLSMMDVKRSFK